MAIKLFNRKPEEDVFVTLDRLMGKMASTETYIEYLREREGMLYSNYWKR
jgi:hypothetical protein